MCGHCHGVSTAIAVRRSPEGWHDLIEDMRARGAQGITQKQHVYRITCLAISA